LEAQHNPDEQRITDPQAARDELSDLLEIALGNKGMTKATLAQRCALSPTTVSHAFNRKRPAPSIRTLTALDIVLGIGLDQLMGLRKIAVLQTNSGPLAPEAERDGGGPAKSDTPGRQSEAQVRAPTGAGLVPAMLGPQVVDPLAVADDGNRLPISGDLIVRARARRQRPFYHHEIVEFEAEEFEGRQAELAEMTAFCNGTDGSPLPYWRWVGPAWCGKTALMAHFALHHPDNIDVLPFFITARMHGRSDRHAFLHVLQRQLGGYLNDTDLDCSDQDTLHDALERAAQQAKASGRHLILLVDGMDEDTGVPRSSAGHSIAALLPSKPPDGLRIVVAGRPHPPVPGDVTRKHPLRDPGIDHPLGPIPVARAIREDAERNLDLLLESKGLERELVVLTAAAGGGLSAEDYARLTDHKPRRVEQILGGSAGRVFQRSTAHLAPAGGKLYYFAHQELLVTTRDMLRPTELRAARDRLHRFVAESQAANWPEETPEFVLLGYPAMLKESGDLERLTELATDRERQERLWESTASDTEALAETLDALELHVTASDPDVGACVRLAVQRDEIQERARSIPSGVVCMWARLGYVRRAVRQASLSHLSEPGDLYGRVLEECRSADDVQTVLDAVFAIPSASHRHNALRWCALALASRKLPEQAEELCLAIEDPEERSRALTWCCLRLAEQGCDAREISELAKRAAEALPPCSWEESATRCRALIRDLVKALGRAGLVEVARALLERTVATDARPDAWSVFCEELAGSGEVRRAVSVVRSTLAPHLHDDALRHVVAAGARTEGWREALDTAADIREPSLRAAARASAAKTLAKAGQWEEAEEAAGAAMDEAREFRTADKVSPVLRDVVGFLVEVGALDQADQLAHQVPEFPARFAALTRVALGWASAGRTENAARTAQEVAEQACSHDALSVSRKRAPEAALTLAQVGLLDEALTMIADTRADAQAVNALIDIVTELVKQGDHERAIIIARSIARTEWRGIVLGAVAYRLAGAGDSVGHTPVALAREATALARSSAHSGLLQWLLHPVQDMALSGNLKAALDVASAIPNPVGKAHALRAVVSGAVRHGSVGEATDLARSITELEVRDRALKDTAIAWARQGRAPESFDLAQSICDTVMRAEALAQISIRLSDCGCVEEAVRAAEDACELIASMAETPQWLDCSLELAARNLMKDRFTAALRIARHVPSPFFRGRALQRGVQHLLEEGQLEEAASLAQSIDEFFWSLEALEESAETFIECGNPDGAEPSISAILALHQADDLPETTRQYVSSKAEEALSAIVSALLDTGQREQALQLAEAAQSDKLKQLAGASSDFPAPPEPEAAETRPDSVNDLPRAVASRSKTPSTRNVREITAGNNDDSTFSQWREVERLVSQGKLDQAADLARAISRGTSDFFNERGRALLQVAGGHAPFDVQRRTLTAEALASGSVTVLVETIAKAVPEVLIDVARCTHSLSLYKHHS
jgi:transcriptional regulator with XRE-family HTH domain